MFYIFISFPLIFRINYFNIKVITVTNISNLFFYLFFFSYKAPDTLANTLESAAERNALAGQYRQRLYDNPESLADAVSVSPVRAGNQIVGYRIAPGANAQAFDTLGFKRGDVVVAVNGLTLSDASNTLKLYQLMKEARQATFDIEREGGTVTISVDLASP